MSDSILYRVDDRVAVISFNRPRVRNALDFPALADLSAAFTRASDDPEVTAVVLTGEGGAFCAGTDLGALADTPESDRRQGGSIVDDGEIPWPIVRCPMPVVAAIDGAAVGMGAELASHCDVRLCSDRARLAWNFVHRGLVPDTGAGTWLLPRLVGHTVALRLLFSGEFIDAARALEIGFVTEVTSPEALLDAALAEAKRLSQGSPYATGLTKALLYDGSGSLPAHMVAQRAALDRAFRSDDHREGVSAFLEKRPPRFTGH